MSIMTAMILCCNIIYLMALLHELWLAWQILKIYKNTTSQISSILVQYIMLIFHTWQCYTGIWHDFEILVMLLLSMLARLLSFSHRTTSLPMKCLMRRGLCGGEGQRHKETQQTNKYTTSKESRCRLFQTDSSHNPKYIFIRSRPIVTLAVCCCCWWW